MRSRRWGCRAGKGTPGYLTPPLGCFPKAASVTLGPRFSNGAPLQCHLGTGYRCKFPDPTPRHLNQKFKGWGLLAIRVFTSGDQVLTEVSDPVPRRHVSEPWLHATTPRGPLQTILMWGYPPPPGASDLIDLGWGLGTGILKAFQMILTGS